MLGEVESLAFAVKSINAKMPGAAALVPRGLNCPQRRIKVDNFHILRNEVIGAKLEQAFVHECEYHGQHVVT